MPSEVEESLCDTLSAMPGTTLSPLPPRREGSGMRIIDVPGVSAVG